MYRSNNNKKRGLNPFLIVLLSVVVAVVLMLCGYILINSIIEKNAPSVKSEDTEPSKSAKADEISPEAKEALKDGGSLIVFVPDVRAPEKVSPEDMEIAERLVRSRLDMNAYPQATVGVDNSNRITIAIPGCDVPQDVANTLKTIAKLEFIDADGNIIMDGSKTYVKDAKYQYGQTSEYSENQHYVQLVFTNEGRKKFKEATAAAMAAAPEKQFISIALDGNPQMSPHVNEVIDSDTCIITGNYTQEEAENVAELINSGLLPFSLKTVKLEYIAP